LSDFIVDLLFLGHGISTMTKRHLLLCVSPGVEPGDSSRRGTPDGARHVPQSVALEPTYPHLKVSLRRALTTLRQQSPREPEPGTSVRSVVSYYFVFGRAIKSPKGVVEDFTGPDPVSAFVGKPPTRHDVGLR